MKHKHKFFKRFHVLVLSNDDADSVKHALNWYVSYMFPTYVYHRDIKRKPNQKRADVIDKKIHACKKMVNYLTATHG